MRDPALQWLYENDPAARGASRRDYAKRVGLLDPANVVDIRANEVPLGEAESSLTHHCRQCARRSAVEHGA